MLVFDAARLGRTGYYGFAFRIDKDWDFDDNKVNLMQFMSDFSDVDCGRFSKRHWMPTVMVWVRGDNLFARYRFGNPCENIHSSKSHLEKHTADFKLGKISPGFWHTVILGIHWHRDKKGWFKVWYDDGEQSDGTPGQFKLVIDKQSVHTLPEVYDDR